MMECDDAKQMLTDVLAGTRIDPRPPRQLATQTQTCVVIGGSTLAVRCVQLLEGVTSRSLAVSKPEIRMLTRQLQRS